MQTDPVESRRSVPKNPHCDENALAQSSASTAWKWISVWKPQTDINSANQAQACSSNLTWELNSKKAATLCPFKSHQDDFEHQCFNTQKPSSKHWDNLESSSSFVSF
ncbi:unnamed protein product [Calypogeia fissa]